MLLRLLLLALVSFSAHAQNLPQGLNQACLDYIKSLPPEIEYDFVLAPQDWNHPETSAKIPIFYYAPNLKQTLSKGIVPYAYYNGGPGSSSHGIYEYFKKNLPEALSVPFLYIDQRGTGCSGQLPNVPVTLEGAKTIALYGSRNIVLDSELIRKKLLADRPWNVFGQSFGGYIVHRYISLFPGSLVKAVAQGSSVKSDGIAWVQDRLHAQKRVAALYDRQFPNDQAILEKARALFPKDYCFGNRTAAYCGPGLLDIFGFRSLTFPKSWNNLHAAISNILKSDESLNLDFLHQMIPAQVSTNPSMNNFLVAVVPGMELPGGLLNQWSCTVAIPELEARGEAPENWMFNECRITSDGHAEYDSFLYKLLRKDYLSLEQVKAGLRQNPALKFHLFSGELDTTVARESYDEEQRSLGPLFHYQNIAEIGHDWFNANAIWAVLKSK